MESGEKNWLKGCEMLCGDLGIDIATIQHCFETWVWSKPMCTKHGYVRNFVGQRWISDAEMDKLLDVVNEQYSDTICFTVKPNKVLCAFSQIQSNLESILRN